MNIDYSKTIIYKISLNGDPIYVGSTTNFIKRKNTHKCKSVNDPAQLYKVIREHGGFDKFEMIPIEEFHCGVNPSCNKRTTFY
jgi:hypothetical protein